MAIFLGSINSIINASSFLCRPFSDHKETSEDGDLPQLASLLIAIVCVLLRLYGIQACI